MSLILKISDVAFTDATLPKLQRDSVVDAGTKFLFDFADAYGWPKQAAPVNGDQFVNLVDGGAPATTVLSGGSTMTFGGGGIGFDQESNEGILLPNSGNLPANNKGFLFALWMKHGTPIDSTTVAAVGGYANQSGQYCQYAISGINSSGIYGLQCNGSRVNFAYPAVGSIHQLAMAVVKSGTNMVLRGYADGAQIGADVVLGAVATWQLPQPSGAGSGVMPQPELGFMSGFGQSWVGSIYRTYLNDIGATGADPLAIVQADFAANSGRFT
ncbi:MULTISPECIES: hypothetical protein [unclassified Burkholderia]|uniref:hypothetical protein n=1 Tax=unclassified Burkholderia TaxID=2613784 RepID=UPI000F56C62B|nr:MULTISPECIES: hypothetical protein [unclassified Burkholderia]RQR81460.1 hypothetical protein DIE10_17820 [Burkholderia sp. Bp9011]RQR91037.1 hypothetical protein DIE09_20060 [Burkholderia sp. Bp9010]RQS75184.1 hypothetical protein DID97_16425 [Burkholderia sp. Bp8977]